MANSQETVDESQSGTLYPTLEGFIESASRAEAGALYSRTRKALEELKVPAAKRAVTGIDLTEGLLMELLDVRERLEAEVRDAKRGRR